jgi:hypothetical protein
MRTPRYLIPALWGILAVGLLASKAFARVESEVSTVEKRRAEVDKARKIAKPTKAEPLPVMLVLPFAPEGFDLTDAEEAAAADAARRQANAATGVPAGPAPPSDHELLESIMSKIKPGGTAVLMGHPILMIGNKFMKIGAHFTVTYKGADYDLELTQIEGSNFTLRYKSEEITRPIQPGK